MEQAIRILEERLESEEREHVRWALEQALAAMRKQIYYVVLRSEEHSDYVERLYKERSKAEEFEGNEDEYGRDIERIRKISYGSEQNLQRGLSEDDESYDRW